MSNNNKNEKDGEEYFKTCLEAVTKQKVTEKNAFSFSIEKLLSVCNIPAVSQNFAKLSMILEVAVDIYSHKVDSVHKMGSEVANTLSACTEDCEVSAARKTYHRVTTNNCDETPKNTDNIIKSRGSEDLRTGGGNQQSRQGVLGTEESLTIIPSGRKYGSSGYQYPHKESVYNMDYYYMTELSGRPKMLHEIELWNSSNNYVGKLVKLEKLNLSKLPTLPTIENYLVREENTETTRSQLRDDCDNDRYERDIHADPQCSISVSDDIQMFADTCHMESEMLSAPLSTVSESNQNNFTNNYADPQCSTLVSDEVQRFSDVCHAEPEMLSAHLSTASNQNSLLTDAFSLNPPSCSAPSFSNRHLKERTERQSRICSSSKRKRKFSDTHSDSSLSNYVSEEFMRAMINSIARRVNLEGSYIVETSRTLNNSYCVGKRQQLNNDTTVVNDGASCGEISFEILGSTRQSILTHDETAEITSADSPVSEVPNSLPVGTYDPGLVNLPQVEANSLDTPGSEIPNSFPTGTCDSGLVDVLTQVDTNSLGTAESDVPNSFLAATCDSEVVNTLSQADTNNVCTSGSDIPNSLPAATCDSGLGDTLSQVDTNSTCTMGSEVPNPLPAATCDSGIDNLKLSQVDKNSLGTPGPNTLNSLPSGICDSELADVLTHVNGDVDEEFYFEFNNNFNGEQSEGYSEGGASANANTYQTALDIPKLFDIPTKPREAGVDSKKIKNTMWEEIKSVLYNGDEPTHETMSLTALFERVCARLSPDETADHNIQVMFFMLLQLANDRSIFCLKWDEDSNDCVIKHNDE